MSEQQTCFQSADKVQALGLSMDNIYEFNFATDVSRPLTAALEGCESLIIVTSGVPKIQSVSLVKVFWAKLTRQEGVRPDFGWKNEETPEMVWCTSVQYICANIEQEDWPCCI